MTTISKEAVLAAQDIKIEEVQVPEWGGSLCVKVMTGPEREDYSVGLARQVGPKGEVETVEQRQAMKSGLLQHTVCDENGVLVFTKEDMPAIMGKSSVVLDRLFSKAMDLNGLSELARQELLKNSAGANVATGSASPAPSTSPSPSASV